MTHNNNNTDTPTMILTLSFNELPSACKKALIQYFAIDGYHKDITGDGWDKLISQANIAWKDRVYHLENATTEDAIRHVWDNSPELKHDYESFDKYHQAYLSGGGIPAHPNSDWPILSSPDGFEALIDGWHRFHAYIEQGFTHIPILHL